MIKWTDRRRGHPPMISRWGALRLAVANGCDSHAVRKHAFECLLTKQARCVARAGLGDVCGGKGTQTCSDTSPAAKLMWPGRMM